MSTISSASCSRNHALADGERIGVVVTAAEFCGFVAPTQCAANSFDLVCRDGFAISRSAHDNGAFGFTSDHGFSSWNDEER
jgi:hypothetical protein